jgi:subtilisin
MPERTSKIVLCKEDVDVQDFASSSVSGAQLVDALEVMATDFEPSAKTVQANPTGAFFVANLTDKEAQELAKTPEVEAVEDDIMVFAQEELPPLPPPLPPDEDEYPFGEELDFGLLERDPEDREAIESVDIFPEWSDEDYDRLDAAQEVRDKSYPEMGPEQFYLLSQLESTIEEADLEIERRLVEGTAEPGAERTDLPHASADILPLIKCVAKCVGKHALERKADVEELRSEDIEAILRSVGVDQESMTRAAADTILWNLRLILANWAWRYSTGQGVRVAIVDTGIESRHPDLNVHGGISYVPGVRSWRDDNGHGTHVAGITAAAWNGRGIVGVAPRARLYAIKVLSRNGSGRLSWILNGLSACYRARMHIVNLSLGSGCRTHNPRVYSRAYERVGQVLRRRGILCVAAAGNSRHRPVGNPARCPSYLAVSAIDRRRRLACFSSVGPQVEICAPGAAIWSTVPIADYGHKSGTSMACPHVAGVAALVKARRPAWHGDRIRVHLWRTVLDLGRPGRDWAFGFGQANAWRAAR